MDSSVSPTHGEQEMSVRMGHFQMAEVAEATIDGNRAAEVWA